MIGRRRVIDDLVDEFLPGRYDPPTAALKIVHKDITSATEHARNIGAPMRFANLALAEIQEAMKRGWAEHDRRCVMILSQERVGIEIKVDPARLAEVLAELLAEDPAAPSDVKHGVGA